MEKTCTSCKISQPITQFNKHPTSKQGINTRCKTCKSAYDKKRYSKPEVKIRSKTSADSRYRSSRESLMLAQAKYRAKKNGLEFNLKLEDIHIPEKCPVLGISLAIGNGYARCTDNLPSLDRVKPELGYVKGNVRVISYRANAIKRDATLAELKALVNYVEQFS